MSAEPIAIFPRTYPDGAGRRTTTQPFKPRLSMATPAAEMRWRDAASYDGAELRPYTGRPGAMRAYELPSLVNGERVERVRPSLISTRGDLKK